MKHEPNVECYIDFDMYTNTFQVRMIEHVSHTHVVAYHMDGDQMKATELQRGMLLPPLLVFQGRSHLQAIADALGKFGIIPDTTDQSRELAATQKHLEDMRDMAICAFKTAMTIQARP